jgi:hypothetical protein
MPQQPIVAGHWYLYNIRTGIVSTQGPFLYKIQARGVLGWDVQQDVSTATYRQEHMSGWRVVKGAVLDSYLQAHKVLHIDGKDQVVTTMIYCANGVRMYITAGPYRGHFCSWLTYTSSSDPTNGRVKLDTELEVDVPLEQLIQVLREVE